MELLFERIQSASHQHLKVLLPLYMESFPQEERRASNDLLRLLNENEMFFMAILEDEQVVGLEVYWKFKGFLYLEHLAVMVSQRKKGVGQCVLEQLRKEQMPVLLEVEIPYDAASANRVTFYERSGFKALPVYYHQPPYREGELVVPMMLFSDLPIWDPEVLRKSIELFHFKVYGVKQRKQ